MIAVYVLACAFVGVLVLLPILLVSHGAALERIDDLESAKRQQAGTITLLMADRAELTMRVLALESSLSFRPTIIDGPVVHPVEPIPDVSSSAPTRPRIDTLASA